MNLPPIAPPIVVTKTIELKPLEHHTPLYEITQYITYLPVLSLLLICGVESYHGSSMRDEVWTLQIGGPVTGIYLLLLLVSVYLRYRFARRFRSFDVVVRQQVTFSDAGLEVAEDPGNRFSTFWTWVDDFRVNPTGIHIGVGSVFSIFIDRRHFTAEEVVQIEKLARARMVRRDNYPTLRRLLGRSKPKA